jgi:RNA polymerase sigma-70 factor, ECF subfamily
MDSGLVSRSEGALSAAAVGAVESAVAAAPAPAPAMDDTALMLRYRDGDVRAFEILYERHKAPLYRYLQRTCHSREVADDVFQEVWSKVIASRGRYEARAQFNTFLFRIAHNCAIDHFRRAGRRQESGAPAADDVAEQVGAAEHERPDAALAESQLRSDFRRALDELPPEQRDVFVLYEESGLSLEDIGKITGVAMETAKSRLRYALAKLRGALEQHRPARLKSGVQT